MCIDFCVREKTTHLQKEANWQMDSAETHTHTQHNTIVIQRKNRT